MGKIGYIRIEQGMVITQVHCVAMLKVTCTSNTYCSNGSTHVIALSTDMNEAQNA